MSDEQTLTNAESRETNNGDQPQPERATYQRALQEELRELAGVVGPGALVDLLLERAFQLGATDIHLDPGRLGLRVRLRVDGLMHDVLMLPLAVGPQVISRIKLMGNMDITEKRISQDGHINNAVLNMQRDIRIGSGPTINGERLVLRLMPDDDNLTHLPELGLEPDQLNMVRQFVNAQHGMVLSVGPVGSGKSTTMYGCLEELNTPHRSLVTIEDPVERRVLGVNQIQVDPKIDFNFVEALRGVLRQDPNVMMIGEIRDPETAHIGCRAALTGVTVLSTLHASDTAATVDMFREFGISPMFIADSLRGIISQRLLRKVCSGCREEYHPDESACHLLGIDPGDAPHIKLARGLGCERCFNTGHLGRTGVFEIMAIRGNIRQAIIGQRSHDDLMAIAVENGMKTLEESARAKLIAGVTSMEEYHRVLAQSAVY